MISQLRRVVATGSVIAVAVTQPLLAGAAVSSTYRIALLAGSDPNGVFGTSNIFDLSLDGTEWSRVTSGAYSKEQPDWSPDGSKLVYTSTPGEFGPANIFTIRADGTGLERLTSGNDYDLEPDWSPDGSLIAFSSDRAGNPNYEIYVMRPDGTGVIRLTNRSGSDGDPDWSPDGRQVAFDHNFEELWAMNADGSGGRLITSCESEDCYEKDEPAWSPDGQTLLFLWGKDPHYELRTVGVDGTGERVLLDCRLPCLGVRDPQWSHDGRYISFTYIDRDAERHAYVMDADGTNPHPISAGPSETCCVAWRPL